MATTMPEPPAKDVKPSGTPWPVKYYLVAYNALSAVGWSYILALIVLHMSGLTGESTVAQNKVTAAAKLSSFINASPWLKPYLQPNAQVPSALVPFYNRATTTYTTIGAVTAFVQSCAVLEVVHAALGWVRSPVQTTAIQVGSRLFAVWGVTELYEVARTNPLYTTMVFAWSFTEVIRYTYYALSLMGYEPYALLWLRYTTFYVLYPLGAGSEALVNYSTLPRSRVIPSFRSWLRAGVWSPYDYFRGICFIIWWPGLYVMYTYMMKQRRKVLGRGNKLGAKPKTL